MTDQRVNRSESIARTIQVTSLALWTPHVFVLLWLGFVSGKGSLGYMATWTATVVPVTYVTAVKLERGDCLMVLAWIVGFLSETSTFGFGQELLSEVPRWLWVAVALAHGSIGGVLCKAKDMEEGRFFPGHAIAERLYVVVPFTIGQWCGFVLTNGWSGAIAVLSTIFLCLSTIGYGVLTHKVLAYFDITGDVIGLISRLFTTSFGAVFGSLVVFSSFVAYLAIPFLTSLMALNALVSSMGIVFEILLYEIA
jgi:hypothetical protein